LGKGTLTGSGGGDRLSGGKDNALLSGGAGNETLRGGTGTDTADYGYLTAGVPVSPNLELFGRVGYGTTRLRAEIGGLSEQRRRKQAVAERVAFTAPGSPTKELACPIHL